MSKFTIQVNDQAVKQAFAKISVKTSDMKPVMADVGEAFKILIDNYFSAQKGPNGQPWAANQLSTIENYLKERGGYTKNGALSKRGQKLLSSKKRLQGITGELRRTIYWKAFADSLIIASPKPYAALQNFGGPFKAWGRTPMEMPARQFMPVDQKGNLTPDAQALLIKRLSVHLGKL